MIRPGAVVFLILLALLLPGATLERLTMDDMVANSSAIVRARVTSTYASGRGPVIYTHYRLQVSERWKGTDAATMDVVVPGGSLGALHQSFSGAPILTSGSEYVLFLWQSRSGLTHVIGLSQGVFTLKSDASGVLTALRPAVTEQLLDSSGKPVAPEAVSVSLDGLRAQVKRSLAAAEKK